MLRREGLTVAASVLVLASCVALMATASTTADRTVLSPVFSENTEPTLVWNGLPENYKFDPFRDEEVEPHTKNGKDPFGPKGQYGMWMGIQPDTEERRFGCGPGGPMDCFVGTTPSEHWVRGSGPDRAKQKQLAAVKEAKKQQLTYWEERTLQPSRQQRWYQVDPLVVVHAHTRKHALPHRTAIRHFGDTDVVPHDHHKIVHGIAGRWPGGGRSGPWLGRCGPSAHVRRGGCGVESRRSPAWRAGTCAPFSRGPGCAGVHLPECAGRNESAVQGQWWRCSRAGRLRLCVILHTDETIVGKAWRLQRLDLTPASAESHYQDAADLSEGSVGSIVGLSLLSAYYLEVI